MTLPKPYYDHAGITIYHGDCLEIMPELEKVDLVLTDPQYGQGTDLEMHKKGGQKHGKAATYKNYYPKTNWDAKTPPPEAFNLIKNISKYSIIFGGNFFDLPPTRCFLVWDKENGDNNFADCELAWTNFDKPTRLKRHLWSGMLRKNKECRWGHPTQKPLEIMEWAIKQAPPDVQTILDPFMGSGTTLVAAKELGRRAIGIEIEEKYCEIAAERLAQEVFEFE